MDRAFSEILERARDHVFFVDKIIKQKIELMDFIMTGTTKYLEASQTATTMLEAAGTEIEGKGRADQRTILGRRNGLFIKEKKGASLSDYYGDKAKSLYNITNGINRLINLSNKEISLDKNISSELSKESQEANKQENQIDKKVARKIKRIEKIIYKARADLKKEFEISDDEIKRINKELMTYVKLRKMIFSAGRRLKRLCGFFPKSTYKKLVRESLVERRLAIRVFRSTHKLLEDFNEEILRLNKIAKDLNQCFKIAEKHKDSNLSSSIKHISEETKHVDALDKLSRVSKRLERRLPKAHNIKDFNQDENAIKFDKDLKNEQEDIRELEKEEMQLNKIEETMTKLESFTAKLLNYSGTLSHQLVYFLQFSNRAYIGAGKFKKNPSQIIPYLNKVKEFVEKSTGKILHRMRDEENKLKEEIGEEKDLFKDYESVLSKLTRTADKKIKKAISKSIKHINKIEKDLNKSFDDGIKNLHREEKHEQRARKADKRLNRFARKADVSVENKYVRKAGKEQGNLKGDEKALEAQKQKLTSEVEKVKTSFSKVQENLPDFAVIRKGSKLKRIHKDINKSFSQEGELPRDINHVLNAYNSWLHNFFDAKKYIEFMDKLANKSNEEEKFLKQFHEVFVTLGKNEAELVSLFEQLKKSMVEIEEADKVLADFEKEFALYLEVGKDLFAQTKNEFNLVKEEIQYIGKIEHSIQAGIQSIPTIESAIEHANSNNKEIDTVIKTAKRKIKPEKIVTQNIISE